MPRRVRFRTSSQPAAPLRRGGLLVGRDPAHPSGVCVRRDRLPLWVPPCESTFGAARVVAVAVALVDTAVTPMHDQLDTLTASDGASAPAGFRLGAMTRTGAARPL